MSSAKKGLFRKSIAKILPYQPGLPIEEVQRRFGLSSVIKLASNENPLGPSPLALKAIPKALASIHRYPDGSCFYLKRGLAKALCIPEDKIIFGNGSDELIDIIIKTFVEPRQTVLTADCTFLEYKICSQINGVKVETVPLRDYKYDLNRMLSCVKRDTKVVFISNPNNPTGTHVSHKGLIDFLKGLPAQVVVVCDEAYQEFRDVTDFPRSLGLIDRYNLIILRSFSKTYGLAGLRIGYALARPEFIEAMQKVRQPFNVNTLAQVAALAALRDRRFLLSSQRVIREGRQYLVSSFHKLGIEFVPSVVNFILFKSPAPSAWLCQALLKKGVIVREMEQFGLPGFIRVSVGTKKENERFIKTLGDLIRFYPKAALRRRRST